MSERGDKTRGGSGLTPKDHGYLNGVWALPLEDRRRVYADKRQEYADNPEALHQIDVYDGESQYRQEMKRMIFEIEERLRNRRERRW
jgi:hypothetical protein